MFSLLLYCGMSELCAGSLRLEAFQDAVVRNIIPDKSSDQFTITTKFKADLMELFTPPRTDATNWTVLEIGAYVGYTTSILASLFKQVVAVDMLENLLNANKVFNARYDNIEYVQLDTMQDAWAPLRNFSFDVAMIDAGHDLSYVTSDIWNVLQLRPRPRILIFDDYSIEPGVKYSVEAFVHAGAIQCHIALGEDAGWTLPDGRPLPGPEGLFCETNGPEKYNLTRLDAHMRLAQLQGDDEKVVMRDEV